MFIILLSFTVIIVVIASIIASYSEQAKTDIMETAARSSATFLEGKLEGDDAPELARLVNNEAEDIRTMLSVVSSNSDDVTVLITDNSGRILLEAGHDREEISEGFSIPKTLMDEVNNGSIIFEKAINYSIFSHTQAVYAVPVYNNYNSVCGTVFVCASSMMLTELLEVIIKAVVVSILWVLLAALIAVYFISDRVISPLKEISYAAKKFASGKFDTRVPVRGRDEVSELAIAFNNMAESLDNYDTMRNTFMSNVSHDLRSPMTSISGFIDGILDGVIPPEKHEYYLQIVSAEIKRLSRLVASLLDLSRIQAGDRKFTMAPFDICEMGREILISFEQKINDKRLDVEFDCDDDRMTVMADRDAIYQIFYNLCDNAVKFSREGGVLSLKVQKLKGRKVLVSVYNEGQGISEADIPYVFERFYKSDKSRGLNKSGVGLGLFISKTIIEAHGEKIWVESDFGEDCCFHFTLPCE
jgi:signal transduction histidine kinase